MNEPAPQRGDLTTEVAKHGLLDFSYADGLAREAIGPAKLLRGRALAEPPTDRPVLLFIPGGYHGAWCYAHFLRGCDAAGVPSAAIDLRGRGETPLRAPVAVTGLHDYANDVIAAIVRLARPVILVGHSLGGMIAPMAVERGIGDVRGLVLLAPSPPANLPNAARVPAVEEGQSLAPPHHDVARMRFLGGLALEGEDAWHTRLCHESATALNQRYRLEIPIDRNLMPASILCISAGLDAPERHPPGQDAMLAKWYGARHADFPKSPHCLMYGPDWAEVLASILDWSKSISPTEGNERACGPRW